LRELLSDSAFLFLALGDNLSFKGVLLIELAINFGTDGSSSASGLVLGDNFFFGRKFGVSFIFFLIFRS